MYGLCFGSGRRPGVARQQVTFSCFAKRKSPKRRRPPVCDPFAALRGKPAACRLRGAPWNSLCAGARRSDNHGESVDEARALRRACHPATAPAQAQPAGVGQPNSQTATRAIAALVLAFAARGACARETGPSVAKRSNGPCGCPLPGFPSGCAEERSGRGGLCAAGHTGFVN